MNEYQCAELKVLKAVIKILEDNKLRYFAIGGSAIGTIRHNGFIPWDDDIDIAMPRKDYELFRTTLYKQLPTDYELLDYDSCRENEFLFTKVHDTKTTMIDMYAKDTPDRYTGAFVDIMPVDGLPSDCKKRDALLDRISYLCQLNGIRRSYISKSNGVLNKLARFILHYVLCILPYNYFTNRILKEISRYDFDDSEYALFTWRMTNRKTSRDRKVYPIELFSETMEHIFEDVHIRIPEMYDEYLKRDFGDYMELPPEGSRNSGHHAWIYDMDRPVAYYKEKYYLDGKK